MVVYEEGTNTSKRITNTELKKGSHDGDTVQLVQTMLNALGFKCGAVDGIYGEKTASAVRAFQAKHYLNVTGTVNQFTMSILNTEYARFKVSNPVVTTSKTIKSSTPASSQTSSSGSNNTSTSSDTGSELFAPGDLGDTVPIGKTVLFTGEYTLSEIQNTLNTAYKKAPALIKARAIRVQSLVDSSIEKMREMYITEALPSVHKKSSSKVTHPSAKTKTSAAINKVVKKPNMDRWPRNIKYGDNGSYVEQLQKLLTDLGYKLGRVDGHFGPKTKAAVLAFQKDYKLKIDGIVGPKTRAALEKA
ncbi:MAG: hypothetical protein K0R00_174 [Herbinix sp.]|jgi:peptidoglycan hydrolase-like protein with peptidoglycan-binding domain|nr:hypothetical protein [Herbinix sp.]